MKMVGNEAIKQVAEELQKYDLVQAGEKFTFAQLHKAIAEKMNSLITANFSRLISFLYRLDISEKKLKALLSNAGSTPAGDIIATLIIERQLQKIETRKAFKSGNDCDEEKW